MPWAGTWRSQSGITGQTCEWHHGSHLRRLDKPRSPLSDVSRTSNIAVSAYLRTAQSVQGQEDMGNDILMARVDLTPVLDGHVGFPA